MKIIGDVQVVLDGKVDPSCAPSLSTQQVPFALGAGAFSNPHSFGETIILGGTAFGTWVDSEGIAHTESRTQELTTPFLLAIGPEERPSEVVDVKLLTVKELYKTLPSRCALVGAALFAPFEGAYLKRSPIYGENINENAPKYWQPDTKERAWAWIVGFITDRADSKGFYQNPGEREISSQISHTHAALVSQKPRFESLKDLSTPPPILAVRHLFTSSMIQEGRIALFPF